MAAYLRFLIVFVDRVFAAGGSIYFWHQAELYRLRNAAAALVFPPLVLMLIGLLLGPWWAVKSIVMSLMLTCTAIFLIVLGVRRAIIGTEITTALVAARPGTTGTVGTPTIAADEYIKIVAAILTSELTIGLLILLLPLHHFPTFSILLIPFGLTLVSAWVWQGGEAWWPPFTRRLAITAIGIVVVANVFPQSFLAVDQISNGIDSDLSRAIAVVGDESAAATWGHVVRLIATVPALVMLYCFVRGYSTVGFILLLVLTVSLFSYWFLTSNQTKTLRADMTKWSESRSPTKGSGTVSLPSGTLRVKNPTDPYVVSRALDFDGYQRVEIELVPNGGGVARTPAMYLPLCGGRTSQYDVLPRPLHGLVVWKGVDGSILKEAPIPPTIAYPAPSGPLGAYTIEVEVQSPGVSYVAWCN